MANKQFNYNLTTEKIDGKQIMISTYECFMSILMKISWTSDL